MAERYQGLPPKLKEAVFQRDSFRCRWCGTTNGWAYDVHHIQYRRGYSYDVIDNLITLCRLCHDFVHDSYRISKPQAQEVLSRLIGPDGVALTGMAVWRSLLNADRGPESETDVHRIRSTGAVGRLIAKVEPDELGSSTG